jgi:hypothetical protein
MEMQGGVVVGRSCVIGHIIMTRIDMVGIDGWNETAFEIPILPDTE